MTLTVCFSLAGSFSLEKPHRSERNLRSRLINIHDVLRATSLFSQQLPFLSINISFGLYFTSLRVAPTCERQEGLRNGGEKLASIHYIRSEFLERDLCEALCRIIYAMIIISKIIYFSSLLHIF